MSGYGYNYDNDAGSGGQYHDGINDPYHQNQQYEYGYHDPYSNAMGDYGDGSEDGGVGVAGYGDYGYGDPSNENGVVGSGGDVDEGDDGSSVSDALDDEIDFNDPRIANLPRILLMGPRRAGKTSIQVSRRGQVLKISLKFWQLAVRTKGITLYN